MYSYGGLGPEDRLYGLTVFDMGKFNATFFVEVCGEEIREKQEIYIISFWLFAVLCSQ